MHDESTGDTSDPESALDVACDVGDFGEVRVGGGIQVEFRARNSSPVASSSPLSAAQVGPADAFTILDDQCAGLMLAPGQDCTVSVHFAAVVFGRVDGTIDLSDGVHDVQCMLRGVGVERLDVEVTPSCEGVRVSSSPSGIDCPDACTTNVSSEVELTTEAPDGIRFEGWTGDCEGTQDCILEAGGQVQAHFAGRSNDTPITLDASGTVGTDPSLDIGPNQRGHVAYEGWIDGDFGRSVVEYLEFDLASGAAVRTHTFPEGASDPALAVDGEGGVHVAYRLGPAPASVAYDYRPPNGDWDGGATQLFESALFPYPRLKTSAEGEVHLSYAGPNDDIVHVEYTGPVSQWSAPASVGSVDGLGLSELAVSVTGELHLAFLDYGAETVRYVRRDQDGAWDAPVEVASGEIWQKPELVTDVGGGVHLVYTQGGIAYYALRNPGGDWADPQPLNVGPVNGTTLAIDAIDGLHLAFHGEDFVLHYMERPQGQRWTAERTLEPKSAAYPSIAVDPQGDVHVAYYGLFELDYVRVKLCGTLPGLRRRRT